MEANMGARCAACGDLFDDEDKQISIRDDDGNTLYLVHEWCYDEDEDGEGR